jgi:hypothetical protein
MYIEEDPGGDPPFAAALLFVRWSQDGDQPVGHLETDYLVAGLTRVDVKRELGSLALHDVKRHLERLITQKQELPDW